MNNIIDETIADLNACGCERCLKLVQALFEVQHNAQRYFAVREYQAGLQGAQGDVSYYERFDRTSDKLVVTYKGAIPS